MPKEIRFAVGSRGDVRSSVWRLWSNKADLYLAARTTAGLSKISFHASGICRYAVISDEPRKPIESWQCPILSARRIAPLFDILVPDFSVPNQYRDRLPSAPKPVTFASPPTRGTKIVFKLLLADKALTEREIENGAKGQTPKIHGSIPLPTANVWLVSGWDTFLEHEKQFVAGLVDKTNIKLKPGSSKDALFYVFMHIFEKVAPPRIVDVPLGADHVQVLDE